MRSVWWVLSLALIVAIVGCGSKGTEPSGSTATRPSTPAKAEETKPSQNAPPASPALPSQPVQQVTTEKLPSPSESVSASSPLKLPADFPSDVPIYKDAVVKSSSQGPQGRSLQLIYMVKAKQEEVVQFYREMGSKLGWKASETSASGSMQLEKEQRLAQISITSEGDTVRCVLMVAK